jgi:uncharacterized protein involved in exopolysaccharide biosynthesis
VPVGGISRLTEVVSVYEGLNLPVMATPSDVFARMLRSRTIAEAVIDSFNLGEQYGTTTKYETYLALMEHTRIEVTVEGLVGISVEDRDPEMSAKLTNAFVAELDRLNRSIASQRAVQNREFIRERVNQVSTQMDSARAEFERFQMKNRAIDFDEQTRLTIEQAISLKVTLAQLDIDIKMNEQVLGKDNPELIERRRRRDLVQQQLDQLEHGGTDSSFFSMPLAAVPSLKGEYEILYSRVQVSERLYTILLEQLEQAKLQENEDIPTISVLDHARVPDIRSRPQRTIIVGASAGGAFVLAVLLALVLEYFSRMRQTSPDDYERAAYVLDTLFGWLPGVRRRRTDK